MLPVVAFMITTGTFASVATGATEKPDGLSTMPAIIATLSRTTSSCASRRVLSAFEPSSRVISSIVVPAGRSFWCSLMYSSSA